MTEKISDEIKSLVIQKWLQGMSRDEIAASIGISTGAASNVIKEWKQAIGYGNAEAFRELALALNRFGINAFQCAVGFRVALVMTKIGVQEDDFEPFMADIYIRCRNQGITPENIASYLTDLLEFSKTTPFSKISTYIQVRKSEKADLEQELERLGNHMHAAYHQVSEIEDNLKIALEKERVTLDQLKWYSGLKQELNKHGIPVEDIAQLANVTRGIEKYGYDPRKVLAEFSYLERLRTQIKSYQDAIEHLNHHYSFLSRDYTSLKEVVDSWNQTITLVNELSDTGFGYKELKWLRNSIKQIAMANNIPEAEAISKFFKDVDDQYDEKLGFEVRNVNLRAESEELTKEVTRLRAQLLMLHSLSPSLGRLIQGGAREQDIIEIAELMKSDSSTFYELLSLLRQAREDVHGHGA